MGRAGRTGEKGCLATAHLNLLRTQTLGYLSNANGADKKLPRPCIRILGGYLKEVPLHGWRGESRLADA